MTLSFIDKLFPHGHGLLGREGQKKRERKSVCTGCGSPLRLDAIRENQEVHVNPVRPLPGKVGTVDGLSSCSYTSRERVYFNVENTVELLRNGRDVLSHVQNVLYNICTG